MIDTHTHLYFPEYGEEIDDIIQDSRTAGVCHFVLPNVDKISIGQMKEFHARYPDVTSMAIGLHPTEVKEDWENLLQIMETEAKTGEYVALGEIGLDLYWDKKYESEQKQAFERQLQLANEFKLPVIIHCREAIDETLEVIKKVGADIPMVFHSFTGSKEDVAKIREVCDPYFGINGVVTYKNAPALREALPVIGIEKIFLETDAPFLSPVPFRGKRNDSSKLGFIRDKIAETLEIRPEYLEEISDGNARKFFHIKT